MTLETAYRIHTDTMIAWGHNTNLSPIRRGRIDSFTRMALKAVNVIQFTAGMHRFGELPTQERLDAAHAELRLLEKMNENANHGRLRR